MNEFLQTVHSLDSVAIIFGFVIGMGAACVLFAFGCLCDRLSRPRPLIWPTKPTMAAPVPVAPEKSKPAKKPTKATIAAMKRLAEAVEKEASKPRETK